MYKVHQVYQVFQVHQVYQVYQVTMYFALVCMWLLWPILTLGLHVALVTYIDPWSVCGSCDLY